MNYIKKSYFISIYRSIFIFISITAFVGCASNLTNKVEPDNRTPLHIAVIENDINAVESLIAMGVKVDAQQGNGVTPLYIASRHGFLEIAKRLIKAGADVNHKIYSISVMKNNKVKQIIEKGWTPLHASAEGHPKMTRFLLDNGANINAFSDKGLSALHMASFGVEGRLEVIKELLSHGAKINQKTRSGGYTPLHNAAISSDIETAKLLISNGAMIEARSYRGVTPLLDALIGFGNKERMIKLLIDNGANVNAKNNEGYTALHNAANEDAKMVELLLKHGADIRAITNTGYTPLLLAIKYEKMKIMKVFLKRIVQLNKESLRDQRNARVK